MDILGWVGETAIGAGVSAPVCRRRCVGAGVSAPSPSAPVLLVLSALTLQSDVFNYHSSTGNIPTPFIVRPDAPAPVTPAPTHRRRR